MTSRGAVILQMALKTNTNNKSIRPSSIDSQFNVGEIHQPEIVTENDLSDNKKNNNLGQFSGILVPIEQIAPITTSNTELTCHNNITKETVLPQHADIPSTSRENFVAQTAGLLNYEEIDYRLSDSEDDPYQDSGSSYCPSPKRNCLSDLEDNPNQDSGSSSSPSSGPDKENKKKRAKKGEGNHSNWGRNQAKTLRMKGKEYKSKRKEENGSKPKIITKSSRKMGERCDSKNCRNSKDKRQCNNITNDQRQEIFSRFWSEMDWKQRKTYVAALVNKAPIVQKTTKNKSRREFSLFYHLKVNDVLLPVCKRMFLATLSLGEWSVINWVKNSHNSGIVSQASSFPNKKKAINDQKRCAIKSFLERLPKLPSHYCRASTSKLYLENLFKSYSEVYELYQKEVDKQLICSKPVFVSEMRTLNIDIFQPRKDQCDLCFSFKQGNAAADEYQKHLIEKDRARHEKSLDKDKALSGEVCAYTMDVQAVQLVPSLEAGMIYFKQKLACHNFTIYSLADNKVICYVWHEGEGGLEANCFASCLIDFLDTEVREEDRFKTKIFYSDGCCAQNRNNVLSNALFHYSTEKNVTILQKYLVKGHSQMECDSVHSTIEAAKKKKKIESPSNYVDIIEQARKSTKGPYVVKYIDHTFFKKYDSINYYSSIRPGLKKGDPCVTHLRALKYSAQGIEFKLNFDDDWSFLPKRINRAVVGTIENLYNGPLAIKGDKYDHLQSLKAVIKRDYHGFYDSLRKS